MLRTRILRTRGNHEPDVDVPPLTPLPCCSSTITSGRLSAVATVHVPLVVMMQVPETAMPVPAAIVTPVTPPPPPPAPGVVIARQRDATPSYLIVTEVSAPSVMSP